MNPEQYQLFISTINQFRDEIKDYSIVKIEIININILHIQFKFTLSNGNVITTDTLELPKGDKGDSGSFNIVTFDKKLDNSSNILTNEEFEMLDNINDSTALRLNVKILDTEPIPSYMEILMLPNYKTDENTNNKNVYLGIYTPLVGNNLYIFSAYLTSNKYLVVNRKTFS